MRRSGAVRIALALIAFVTGVANGAGAETATLVVATNTILADIAREISGDRADVRCLVAPGVDLHGFEPKPGDVAPLARASLVVANGAGFEPWLEKLIANSGFHGPIARASEGCTLIERDGPASQENAATESGHEHEGRLDPHAWQDPRNGIRYAENIRDALAAVDPEGAESYRKRARLYIAQLESLDAWTRRLFAPLPPERRRFVTSHDSLAYFGRAYALEIIPVRGLDSRQEPDARQIAALIDMLRAQKIRAIFVEAVSNPKMLEQLSRDTGAVLGGELFTDSLGPVGSPASTYLGLLRENALQIATALKHE